MVSEIISSTTQTTVKKENGATLVMPAWFTVEAQPIGRGTTEPTSMPVNLALFGGRRIDFEIIGHRMRFS